MDIESSALNNSKNDHKRIKRGKLPGQIGDATIQNLLEGKDVALRLSPAELDVRTAARDGKLIREPIIKKTRAVLKERTRDAVKRELE
ncbi:hypothetical protein [Polaromonas sp. CF318]|uniref:hypothetical protein n=1 Tax=Polaromonas sp. CF318 TaxID=1144318 RepID=UPI00138AD7D4|nr:hypothetical protein [Polaromonas sp. CF318]